MPRAPETPTTSDAFDLAGFSDALAVTTSAGVMNNYRPAPYPMFLPTPSHPILTFPISNYIKFQVPTAGTHYTKWRQIVIALLTMYQAMEHITEGAAPAVLDATWKAVDIQISLWFLETLSDDLHRLVQAPDGSVCGTWTRLHRFFRDNGSSWYLYLNRAFHNCPCGDLNVTDYASKL
jgi:hypothetical protein